MRNMMSGFGTFPLEAVKPPKGLHMAMEGLAREVLKYNPSDIYKFAAEYFEKLVQLREQFSLSGRCSDIQELVRASLQTPSDNEIVTPKKRLYYYNKPLEEEKKQEISKSGVINGVLDPLSTIDSVHRQSDKNLEVINVKEKHNRAVNNKTFISPVSEVTEALEAENGANDFNSKHTNESENQNYEFTSEENDLSTEIGNSKQDIVFIDNNKIIEPRDSAEENIEKEYIDLVESCVESPKNINEDIEDAIQQETIQNNSREILESNLDDSRNVSTDINNLNEFENIIEDRFGETEGEQEQTNLDENSVETVNKNEDENGDIIKFDESIKNEADEKNDEVVENQIEQKSNENVTTEGILGENVKKYEKREMHTDDIGIRENNKFEDFSEVKTKQDVEKNDNTLEGNHLKEVEKREEEETENESAINEENNDNIEKNEVIVESVNSEIRGNDESAINEENNDNIEEHEVIVESLDSEVRGNDESAINEENNDNIEEHEVIVESLDSEVRGNDESAINEENNDNIEEHEVIVESLDSEVRGNDESAINEENNDNIEENEVIVESVDSEIKGNDESAINEENNDNLVENEEIVESVYSEIKGDDENVINEEKNDNIEENEVIVESVDSEIKANDESAINEENNDNLEENEVIVESVNSEIKANDESAINEENNDNLEENEVIVESVNSEIKANDESAINEENNDNLEKNEVIVESVNSEIKGDDESAINEENNDNLEENDVDSEIKGDDVNIVNKQSLDVEGNDQNSNIEEIVSPENENKEMTVTEDLIANNEETMENINIENNEIQHFENEEDADNQPKKDEELSDRCEDSIDDKFIEDRESSKLEEIEDSTNNMEDIIDRKEELNEESKIECNLNGNVDDTEKAEKTSIVDVEENDTLIVKSKESKEEISSKNILVDSFLSNKDEYIIKDMESQIIIEPNSESEILADVDKKTEKEKSEHNDLDKNKQNNEMSIKINSQEPLKNEILNSDVSFTHNTIVSPQHDALSGADKLREEVKSDEDIEYVGKTEIVENILGKTVENLEFAHIPSILQNNTEDIKSNLGNENESVKEIDIYEYDFIEEENAISNNQNVGKVDTSESLIHNTAIEYANNIQINQENAEPLEHKDVRDDNDSDLRIETILQNDESNEFETNDNELVNEESIQNIKDESEDLPKENDESVPNNTESVSDETIQNIDVDTQNILDENVDTDSTDTKLTNEDLAENKAVTPDIINEDENNKVYLADMELVGDEIVVIETQDDTNENSELEHVDATLNSDNIKLNDHVEFQDAFNENNEPDLTDTELIGDEMMKAKDEFEAGIRKKENGESEPIDVEMLSDEKLKNIEVICKEVPNEHNLLEFCDTELGDSEMKKNVQSQDDNNESDSEPTKTGLVNDSTKSNIDIEYQNYIDENNERVATDTEVVSDEKIKDTESESHSDLNKNNDLESTDIKNIEDKSRDVLDENDQSEPTGIDMVTDETDESIVQNENNNDILNSLSKELIGFMDQEIDKLLKFKEITEVQDVNVMETAEPLLESKIQDDNEEHDVEKSADLEAKIVEDIHDQITTNPDEPLVCNNKISNLCVKTGPVNHKNLLQSDHVNTKTIDENDFEEIHTYNTHISDALEEKEVYENLTVTETGDNDSDQIESKSKVENVEDAQMIEQDNVKKEIPIDLNITPRINNDDIGYEDQELLKLQLNSLEQTPRENDMTNDKATLNSGKLSEVIVEEENEIDHTDDVSLESFNNTYNDMDLSNVEQIVEDFIALERFHTEIVNNAMLAKEKRQSINVETEKDVPEIKSHTTTPLASGRDEGFNIDKDSIIIQDIVSLNNFENNKIILILHAEINDNITKSRKPKRSISLQENERVDNSQVSGKSVDDLILNKLTNEYNKYHESFSANTNEVLPSSTCDNSEDGDDNEQLDIEIDSFKNVETIESPNKTISPVVEEIDIEIVTFGNQNANFESESERTEVMSPKDHEESYTDSLSNDNTSQEQNIFEKASIIIQKVFRGFRVRKNIKTENKTEEHRRDSTEDAIFEKIEEPILEIYNKSDTESINTDLKRRLNILLRSTSYHSPIDSKLYTVSEEKNLSSTDDESSTFSSAATKIQAGVRGFLTRKYFQRNKTGNSSDTTAPSIGEDSRSIEEYVTSADMKSNADDSLSKIVVATSTILMEQLEHFEKMETPNPQVIPGINLTEVIKENDDVMSRVLQNRKRLRREDAIQVHSPYSSGETPSNRQPSKVSEDDEQIGELAQSIITEIEASNYTPVVHIKQSEVAPSPVNRDINLDRSDDYSKSNSEKNVTPEFDETRDGFQSIDNDDNAGSELDHRIEHNISNIRMAYDDSFNSDTNEPPPTELFYDKRIPRKLPRYVSADVETLVSKHMVDDMDDTMMENNDKDQGMDAESESVENVSKNTVGKDEEKIVEGILHSSEFHDTIVLPTKIIRKDDIQKATAFSNFEPSV